MALPGVQPNTGDRDTVYGPLTIQEFIADLHAKIRATLKKTAEDNAQRAEQMRNVRDQERQRFESQIEIATWNLNAANEAVGILRERLHESRMECARLKEEIERLKQLLQANKFKGKAPEGEVESLLATLQELREWKQDAKERNLYLTRRFEDIRKKYTELQDYDRTITSQLEAAHEEIRWLRQQKGPDGHDTPQATVAPGLQVPIVLPAHINVIKQSLELASREIERANSRIDSIKRPGAISFLTQGQEELAKPSTIESDPPQGEGRESHRELSSRRDNNGGLDGLWDSPGEGDSEETLVPRHLDDEQTEALISFAEEQPHTRGRGNGTLFRPRTEEDIFDRYRARQASTSAIEDGDLTLTQGQRTTLNTAVGKEDVARTRRTRASFSLLENEDVPPPQTQPGSVSLVADNNLPQPQRLRASASLVEESDDRDLLPSQRQRAASTSTSNAQGDAQSEIVSAAQSPWSPWTETKDDSNSPSRSKLKPWEIFNEEKGGTEPLIDPLFEIFPRPPEDSGVPYLPKLDFSSMVDDLNNAADGKPKTKRVSFSMTGDGEDNIQTHSPESLSTWSGESESPSPQISARLPGPSSTVYDKEIYGFYRNILREIEEIIENRDRWSWWIYAFDDSLVLSTHEGEVLKEGHKCFLCRGEMIGGEGSRWKQVSVRDRKLRARSKFFDILYDMLLSHCEWTKADEGVDIILGHINQPYVGPSEIKSWVDTTYKYLPSSQPGPGKAVDATRRIFEYFQPILSPAATRDDRAELLKRLSKLCHATHALGKKIYKSRFYELRKVALGGKDAISPKACWVDPRFMEGKLPDVESTREDWTGRDIAYGLSAAVLKHDKGSSVVVLEKAQVVVKKEPGLLDKMGQFPLSLYPLTFFLYWALLT